MIRKDLKGKAYKCALRSWTNFRNVKAWIYLFFYQCKGYLCTYIVEKYGHFSHLRRFKIALELFILFNLAFKYSVHVNCKKKIKMDFSINLWLSDCCLLQYLLPNVQLENNLFCTVYTSIQSSLLNIHSVIDAFCSHT